MAVVFTTLLGVLGDTQSFAANKVADHNITCGVKNALRHDARIDAFEITMRSQEGIVTLSGKFTLSGKVATWSEAQEARLLAGEVRGVKDVTHGLWAEHRGRRNDQEIKDDAVKCRLGISTDEEVIS